MNNTAPSGIELGAGTVTVIPFVCTFMSGGDRDRIRHAEIIRGYGQILQFNVHERPVNVSYTALPAPLASLSHGTTLFTRRHWSQQGLAWASGST